MPRLRSLNKATAGPRSSPEPTIIRVSSSGALSPATPPAPVSAVNKIALSPIRASPAAATTRSSTVGGGGGAASPRKPGLASRGPPSPPPPPVTTTTPRHHHHPPSPPLTPVTTTTPLPTQRPQISYHLAWINTFTLPPVRPEITNTQLAPPGSRQTTKPPSKPSVRPTSISTIPSAGYAPRTRNPSVPPVPPPGPPSLSDEHTATGKDGRQPGTKRKPRGVERAGGRETDGVQEERRIHILVEGRRVRLPVLLASGLPGTF